MDEKKVNVVRAQFAERILYTVCSFFFAGVRNPYFGGKEELVTRYAAFGNSVANAFFVIICLRRIYQPVTCIYGIQYTTLALLGDTWKTP